MEHHQVSKAQGIPIRKLMHSTAPVSSNLGADKFFQDFGVWKDAPVLIGSTKYEPLPDVKNIMITGGAGFM